MSFRRIFKFRIRNTHRNLPKAMGRTETGHGTGPAGRIERLRQLVTAVVRHERIEGNFAQLDETRGYVEKLLLGARKHGDQHQDTMELANYWLLEKDLVHKLFKVLVPRYQQQQSAMTAMHTLPTVFPGKGFPQAILELRGNPWPPVKPHQRDANGTLVNILVSELRKETMHNKLQAGSVDGNPQKLTDYSEPNVRQEGTST